MKKIGFIGCGNMGGALVEAVAKFLPGNEIAVCDFDSKKTQYYEKTVGATVLSAVDVAKYCNFIVLGVKPQVCQQAILEIKPFLNSQSTVISMMAGVSTNAIQQLFGCNVPVIRIMPNTPAKLGAGMILYTLNNVEESVEKEFLELFQYAGVLDALSEDKIDAGSALSGCGPAFVYAFAEALADAGVECGLPRDKALLYASQTLLGASEMLLKYGHPADLKDAVCSPGGTTIAGIHALERNGFRGATMDAVLSAYKRTLELKK